MEFLKNVKINTDNLHFELINGDIFVEEILANEDDIKKVQDAINTIDEFITAAENSDIIEYR